MAEFSTNLFNFPVGGGTSLRYLSNLICHRVYAGTLHSGVCAWRSSKVRSELSVVIKWRGDSTRCMHSRLLRSRVSSKSLSLLSWITRNFSADAPETSRGQEAKTDKKAVKIVQALQAEQAHLLMTFAQQPIVQDNPVRSLGVVLVHLAHN
ncbi:hypothetical protein DL98DRAFT_227139 [Cadophora sp. DSE1049]|nr:hypothetical protein DL98DRAFT_227139 [Cadophora sp. DSE1049]